jgi:hypothetical protein
VLLARYRVLETVTRLRPGTRTDSDGDPVESWSTPDRLKLRAAQIQDGSSEEADGATTGEKKLFAPGRVDVLAEDRIEVGAEVWRVNGAPIVRSGLASGLFTTAHLTRLTR